MKPRRQRLAIWLGSLLAGCAGASTSIRETTDEVALEVHAASAERWCGGKGSFVVGLFNPSNVAVNVITDQWHLEQQAWPGDYSYWYDFSKEEGRGGISGLVTCACSHGQCPEPCGGPVREVVIASRTRRDWRIPVEIETLAPGAHTFHVHLRWHERGRGRSPSPREYQAEFQLLVGEVERDCADVRLGPPNPAAERQGVGGNGLLAVATGSMKRIEVYGIALQMVFAPRPAVERIHLNAGAGDRVVGE